jgi:hypothetical protein
MDSFERGLSSWTHGDFAAARAEFEAVIVARGGVDGPSQFYLDRLGRATASPSWTGEVALEEK